MTYPPPESRQRREPEVPSPLFSNTEQLVNLQVTFRKRVPVWSWASPAARDTGGEAGSSSSGFIRTTELPLSALG